MVKFFEKNHEILAAAAIWDQWVNKETGEVLESFSILTDNASLFVKKIGHDREPVFIKDTFFEEWLSCPETKGELLIKSLRSNKAQYDYDVAVDRPLKSKKK
jgi:putative SOS response-associated peptidase YedK